MAYFLYILRCADDTLYTGITTDLERRLAEHNGEGRTTSAGAKYTRTRRPVAMIYSKRYKDRSAASVAEAAIKKMSREEKLAIAAGS